MDEREVDERGFTPETWGRFSQWPVPEMVEFGKLVRYARNQASLTQHQLAALSGVSQSSICRLERGLVPSMHAWKLVKVAFALGGRLPLGFCPHDHECAFPHYTASQLRTLGRSTTWTSASSPY
jgi:transcriptional regulator with XRE-family HTH domain